MSECRKTQGWDQRLDARAHMLKLWARGDYRWKYTHWCAGHRKWHMSRSKPNQGGKNPAYREGK